MEALTACGGQAGIPGPDDANIPAENAGTDALPDDAPDQVPEPEPSGWDLLLDEAGFISNSQAYGTTRGEYRDQVGEPYLSQVTYYDDFQADIYLVGDPASRVIEINYELASLSDQSKPAMIRMTDLDDTPLQGMDPALFGSGVRGLSDMFRDKTIAELLSDPGWTLGEPVQSDDSKWGFATWYAGQDELSVYLDGDGKVLYFQSRSMMEDLIGDESMVEAGPAEQ